MGEVGKERLVVVVGRRDGRCRRRRRSRSNNAHTHGGVEQSETDRRRPLSAVQQLQVTGSTMKPSPGPVLCWCSPNKSSADVRLRRGANKVQRARFRRQPRPAASHLPHICNLPLHSLRSFRPAYGPVPTRAHPSPKADHQCSIK